MMKEIQELMNNKELLHKIAESDKEPPYESTSNSSNNNGATINSRKQSSGFPTKKVSIEEHSTTTLYDRKKSPRSVRMINNAQAVVSENGRSPSMRRAAERSPMRTIRAIENNNSNGRPSPRETNKQPSVAGSFRDGNLTIASPLSSDKVLHNYRVTEHPDKNSKVTEEYTDKVLYNKATEYQPTVNASPVSSISSKTSSLSRQLPTAGAEVFENLPDVQVYGTTFQSFHTPSLHRIKQRAQRPRIEDDIYDDIDIRKTPKGSDRVLINNNTPEDDVIDSPFQNLMNQKEENGIMLEKESLNFASFCDSNNSLEEKDEQGSLDCSMMTPPPPPIIDMEGHGCKCPKKLRCLLETGLLVLLFYLYTF